MAAYSGDVQDNLPYSQVEQSLLRLLGPQNVGYCCLHPPAPLLSACALLGSVAKGVGGGAGCAGGWGLQVQVVWTAMV